MKKFGLKVSKKRKMLSFVNGIISEVCLCSALFCVMIFRGVVILMCLLNLKLAMYRVFLI